MSQKSSLVLHIQEDNVGLARRINMLEFYENKAVTAGLSGDWFWNEIYTNIARHLLEDRSIIGQLEVALANGVIKEELNHSIRDFYEHRDFRFIPDSTDERKYICLRNKKNEVRIIVNSDPDKPDDKFYVTIRGYRLN